MPSLNIQQNSLIVNYLILFDLILILNTDIPFPFQSDLVCGSKLDVLIPIQYNIHHLRNPNFSPVGDIESYPLYLYGTFRFVICIECIRFRSRGSILSYINPILQFVCKVAQVTSSRNFFIPFVLMSKYRTLSPSLSIM